MTLQLYDAIQKRKCTVNTKKYLDLKMEKSEEDEDPDKLFKSLVNKIAKFALPIELMQ